MGKRGRGCDDGCGDGVGRDVACRVCNLNADAGLNSADTDNVVAGV